MSDLLSTSVIIRAAMPADLPALMQLIDLLNTSEGNAVRCSKSALNRVFFGEKTKVDSHICVAEISGVVVGFSFYYWGYDLLSESTGLHLSDILVEISHRRSGVGRKLLKHIAQYCLAENGQWLSLTLGKNNQIAHEFYQHSGLQLVDADFMAIGKTGLQKLIAD